MSQTKEVTCSPDMGYNHIESVILRTFRFLLTHDGAGEMKINVKILKRGQKEILLQCGRVYRFVVDAEGPDMNPVNQGGETK